MIHQITFCRIRSVRAPAIAVLRLAFILIAIIAFYPERPSHAANYKRRQSMFEDRVATRRAINVWAATSATNAPDGEQNNDSVKVARIIDALNDTSSEWRSVFSDKYFRVDGITHLFDIPPKMAVRSTSVDNIEVAALLQRTKTIEIKADEGIHWKEAAFVVTLVILLMFIPGVIAAFKEMENPGTTGILPLIGFILIMALLAGWTGRHGYMHLDNANDIEITVYVGARKWQMPPRTHMEVYVDENVEYDIKAIDSKTSNVIDQIKIKIHYFELGHLFSKTKLILNIAGTNSYSIHHARYIRK